jgi:hypothetical protein
MDEASGGNFTILGSWFIICFSSCLGNDAKRDDKRMINDEKRMRNDEKQPSKSKGVVYSAAMKYYIHHITVVKIFVLSLSKII